MQERKLRVARRRYTKEFREFAVERLRGCENIVALARELQVSRRLKPEFNAANVAYAAEKAESVRRLRRTSAPIPHAGGKFDPIVPPPILAGILTLDSEWKPAFGKPFAEYISDLGDTPGLGE